MNSPAVAVKEDGTCLLEVQVGEQRKPVTLSNRRNNLPRHDKKL